MRGKIKPPVEKQCGESLQWINGDSIVVMSLAMGIVKNPRPARREDCFK
jgi:hypothetical protein